MRVACHSKQRHAKTRFDSSALQVSNTSVGQEVEQEARLAHPHVDEERRRGGEQFWWSSHIVLTTPGLRVCGSCLCVLVLELPSSRQSVVKPVNKHPHLSVLCPPLHRKPPPNPRLCSQKTTLRLPWPSLALPGLRHPFGTMAEQPVDRKKPSLAT
jgi:hypothetical protein